LWCISPENGRNSEEHPVKNLFGTIACALAAAVVLCAQGPPSAPAAPVEPILAIVEAFRSHRIVALGNVEGGNEQSHAFQLALLRDSRFTAVATDILVEFGNALHQDVVDRFVRGEDVPYESLRRVWQDTTQVEFEWDLPIYEEFFRAVRTVNASLPRPRQLRVLLGDPPVDWGHVHNLQDLQKAVGDRDGYAVEVLRREVLAKGRRALVIYGGQHLLRRSTVAGAADEWAGGIIARMERDRLTSAFTILPETRRDLRALHPDVASWPIPSLAALRGTGLGSTIWDPRPQRRPVRMEEQFDAILYLGPPSSMTAAKLAPALCSDRIYMQMRRWRLGLIPPPPGVAVTLAEQLKDHCANSGKLTEVPDREPAITKRIGELLREAAQGKVNPDSIAIESRSRLIPFLESDGPRFLGRAGELESLALLEESDSSGRRMRRYRSVFASGLRIIWTVELSSTGAVVSLNPRPEE
jgi:hypothetical protein